MDLPFASLISEARGFMPTAVALAPSRTRRMPSEAFERLAFGVQGFALTAPKGISIPRSIAVWSNSQSK